MTDTKSLGYTRRQLIATGLAGGLLTARGLRAAQESQLPLIRHSIPVSGERLPVIGIGTNSFQPANIDALRPVLRRMTELGGMWIDTAAAYGESEVVIGQILDELKLRNQVFLATKLVGDGVQRTTGPGALGSEWDGVTGLASFERSLQRLRTDHVDLLQVHSLRGLEATLPQILQWKKAGKVRYVGVTTSSGSEHQSLMDAMRRYPLDFVQVDYSLANRQAAETVLPLAKERRMGVSVNLPLGGKRLSLVQEAGTTPLPVWAATFGAQTWSQFFLKYVVSHPAVTCAVPGSTRVEHLEDNQGAGRGRLPDAATRKRMEAFWDARA